MNQSSKKDTKITQFGRVLSTLNIDIIFANSPQAKGRVERANKMLQDRHLKEMRLEGILFNCSSKRMVALLYLAV